MDFLILVTVVFSLWEKCSCDTDPCSTYTNVSDTTLMTDYMFVKGTHCDAFPKTSALTWYRYTANGGGAMATSCPARDACGALEQIWIKDTLPSYAQGVSTVTMCISTGVRCCLLENKIQVKHCNSFYVFELRQSTKCETKYCFNATVIELVTHPTTPTTTTASTTIATTTPTPTTMRTTSSTTIATTTASTTIATTKSTPTTIATTTVTTASTSSPTTVTTTASMITTGSFTSTIRTTLKQSTIKVLTEALTHSLHVVNATTKETSVNVTTTGSSTTVKSILTTSDLETDHNQSGQSKQNINTKAIAGGVCSAIIVLSVGIALFIFLKRKKFRSMSTLPTDVVYSESHVDVKRKRFDPSSIRQITSLSQNTAQNNTD